MTGISIFAPILALALTANAADVVVYGGTSAGVMPAVQAARMGRSVVLVAPEKHIGGMPVEGLGSADINNHWFRNDVAVGGLAREFYRAIGRKYGHTEPVYKYESHMAEEVFRRTCCAKLVWSSSAAAPAGALATSIEWVPAHERFARSSAESGKRIEGSVFIDATIEGDLLAAAGVQTTSGREANSKYGETKNGIRAETTHAQFKVSVDPYRVPGDAASGLIPTIQDEPLVTPGAGDNNIQAFCFRLCLTKNPANRLPIAKPEDFDRSRMKSTFGTSTREEDSGSPRPNLPNGKTDLGSWHDLSANLYGMNREWPNGSYATREAHLSRST